MNYFLTEKRNFKTTNQLLPYIKIILYAMCTNICIIDSSQHTNITLNFFPDCLNKYQEDYQPNNKQDKIYKNKKKGGKTPPGLPRAAIYPIFHR
jgi:hypothetical protein